MRIKKAPDDSTGKSLFRAVFNSPVGPLLIEADGGNVLGCSFADEGAGANIVENRNPVIDECFRQLTEYFSGNRKTFDLPLLPEGTEFQKKGWTVLTEIPYGETITYGEMAKRMGSPKAVRAVGGVNHANKIAVIIPCHRVIGKNGKLTGFGGGLWRKEWLLEHETKHSGAK